MTSFHTFIENWKIEPSLEKIIQDKLEEEEDLNYCKQIKGFINKLPEEVQLLVRQQMYEKVLLVQPFFNKNFSSQLLQKISQIPEEVTIQKGKNIFKRGDSSDSLYFLIEGQLNKDLESQNFRSVEQSARNVINQIQIFGIEEFITQEVRKTTITTKSDCLLAIINYKQFYEVLNQFSKDKEIFCMLRDQLLFEQNSQKVFEYQSNQVNSFISKSRIIDQLLNQQIQIRNKQGRKNLFLKYNTLGNIASTKNRSLQYVAHQIQLSTQIKAEDSIFPFFQAKNKANSKNSQFILENLEKEQEEQQQIEQIFQSFPAYRIDKNSKDEQNENFNFENETNSESSLKQKSSSPLSSRRQSSLSEPTPSLTKSLSDRYISIWNEENLPKYSISQLDSHDNYETINELITKRPFCSQIFTKMINYQENSIFSKPQNQICEKVQYQNDDSFMKEDGNNKKSKLEMKQNTNKNGRKKSKSDFKQQQKSEDVSIQEWSIFFYFDKFKNYLFYFPKSNLEYLINNNHLNLSKIKILNQKLISRMKKYGDN